MEQLKVDTYSINFKLKLHTSLLGIVEFDKDVQRAECRAGNRLLSGQWQVVLVPQEHDHQGQTAYEMIKPMDYAELLVSRNGPEPIVVMRGFVTRISKTISIENGIPRRSIIIEGEDYGKLIRMATLHYAAGFDPVQVIAATGTQFPFLLAYGTDLVTKAAPPSEVIRGIFDTFVYPWFVNIQKLQDERNKTTSTKGGFVQGDNEPAIALSDVFAKTHSDDVYGAFELDIDADGVDGLRGLNKKLQIIDPAVGLKEQGITELMQSVAGLPWNELFVDNAPEISYLVYRPFPFRDRYGRFIGCTALTDKKPLGMGVGISHKEYTPPLGRDVDVPIRIPFQDIISVNLSRTDEGVYNYFFTDAIYAPIGNPFEFVMRARSITEQTKNPRYISANIQYDLNDATKTLPGFTDPITGENKLEYSRIELFGLRPYYHSTRMLALMPGSEATDPAMIETAGLLNDILVHGNEHNSALEDGTIVIKGNEHIRQGMFIALEEERLWPHESWYYVTDVQHVVIPLATFVTQLTVTRGEGWLNRTEERSIK